MKRRQALINKDIDRAHETFCHVEPVDVTPEDFEEDTMLLEQLAQEDPLEQANRSMVEQVKWLMANEPCDNNGNPWTFESAYKSLVEEQEMIEYLEWLEEAQKASPLPPWHQPPQPPLSGPPDNGKDFVNPTSS